MGDEPEPLNWRVAQQVVPLEMLFAMRSVTDPHQEAADLRTLFALALEEKKNVEDDNQMLSTARLAAQEERMRAGATKQRGVIGTVEQYAWVMGTIDDWRVAGNRWPAIHTVKWPDFLAKHKATLDGEWQTLRPSTVERRYRQWKAERR